MTIQELFSGDFVKLPKQQPADKQFNEYFSTLLNEYLSAVKHLEIPDTNDVKEILNNLTIIVKGLISTVNAYYRGSPFDAYRRLRDTINKSSIENYWNSHETLKSRNLYRIRTINTNYPLSRQELFHIPFHLRGNITTQRYSIPGFPSLYLSNTIYVAWEELKRPNLDSIQAVRFVNKVPLNLIDLTTSRYWGNYETQEIETIKTDILMWPFIVASSIKVKNPENSFKPEYIIPQLLLQWIRNNKMTASSSSQKHGIKFSSTHIDLNKTKSTGNFFNVVIPVVENKEVGYCSKISELFQMTEILSWQLYEFSMAAPGVAVIYTRREIYDHADIKQIEIIKDRVMPYSFSPLARIESVLQGMTLHDIDFC
jgi:hypothetical protein